MDRQSEAFRLAGEADWAAVDLNQCVVIDEDDPVPIRGPEVFEHHRWDEGRQSPKTVAEAKVALLARIADPAAPDDESVAAAYDDLED